MINTRRKGKQRKRMGALDLEGNNLKQGHQGRSERVTFDQRLKKEKRQQAHGICIRTY